MVSKKKRNTLRLEEIQGENLQSQGERRRCTGPPQGKRWAPVAVSQLISCTDGAWSWNRRAESRVQRCTWTPSCASTPTLCSRCGTPAKKDRYLRLVRGKSPPIMDPTHNRSSAQGSTPVNSTDEHGDRRKKKFWEMGLFPQVLYVILPWERTRER